MASERRTALDNLWNIIFFDFVEYTVDDNVKYNEFIEEARQQGFTETELYLYFEAV